MANYAIMRCKKLTGMGSVASALQHCYRERETPNANAERTPENYCSVLMNPLMIFIKIIKLR